MRTRLAGVAAALAVTAAACGGPPDVYDVPPGGLAIELPPPVPAVPAWVVTSQRPLAPKAVAALERVPGVAVAAPVATARRRIERGRVEVGAVEPLRFRAVAPPAARSADFVWTALLAGRAVVGFDAAGRLGLRSARRITLGGRRIPVGAVADNGTPPVADVLVDGRLGRRLGIRKVRTVVVGAETGVTIERLGRDLRRRLPGATVRRVRRPEPGDPPAAPRPVAAPGGAAGTTLPALSFRILRNGFIDPDDAWVDANITAAVVPIFGSVKCHRVMVPPLRAALEEIVERGLAGSIRPRDYGGCWVPRFIDRDPSKPLSMHAFGLAIDFNVSTNALGTRGDMDPGVVEVFERWGFEWGGRWSRPDPMHFELARIVSVP